MTFARVVFAIAGAVGLLAMVPMYLAAGSVRYYGSLGGLVAWQFAFFLIASDPARSRMMMIPAMIEKFLWVGTMVALYFWGHMSSAEVFGGTIPHGILGVLFVACVFQDASRATEERVSKRRSVFLIAEDIPGFFPSATGLVGNPLSPAHGRLAPCTL